MELQKREYRKLIESYSELKIIVKQDSETIMLMEYGDPWNFDLNEKVEIFKDQEISINGILGDRFKHILFKQLEAYKSELKRNITFFKSDVYREHYIKMLGGLQYQERQLNWFDREHYLWNEFKKRDTIHIDTKFELEPNVKDTIIEIINDLVTVIREAIVFTNSSISKDEIPKIVDQQKNIQTKVFGEILTNEEAAEYLKINEKTLKKMRDEGVIKAYHKGSVIRYKKEDLDKLFDL